MSLITWSINDLETEVRFFAVRSRGPGGQNVNKVSSSALLVWDFQNSVFLSSDQKALIQLKLNSWINADGALQIRSDEFRDLPRNKDRCLEKLQNLLSAAFFKQKERRKTKPTRSSQRKRVEEKRHRSEIKGARKVRY